MTQKTRKKRNGLLGGAKPLSPGEIILAESGKEQLHLLLMVMCVFLHKYYVASRLSDKVLYTEELVAIIKILRRLKTQNEEKLKNLFGVKDNGPLVNMDNKDDGLEDIDKTLRMFHPEVSDELTELNSKCIGKCYTTFDVPGELVGFDGELLKQVSLKFRLVIFLTNIIGLLSNALENQTKKLRIIDGEDANETNVIKGKVFETRMKIRAQVPWVVTLLTDSGYKISSEVINAYKQFFNKIPKPRHTSCKRTGGAINYNKALLRTVKNATTRVGAFISGPESEVRDKYQFLLYFKSFTQFYEDNTQRDIKFNASLDRRGIAEYLGKSIYEMFLSTYRLYVKNNLSSIILIGTTLASYTLSTYAYYNPAYAALNVAKKLASVGSSAAPFVLAPYVDNPLMPIFRKVDIKRYNADLVSQSVDAQNLKKITEISENYVKIIAIILKQPILINFAKTNAPGNK